MAEVSRIYADTSVFGGLFEPEFQRGSERFLELVNLGLYSLVLSDIVLRELAPAPQRVRDVLNTVSPLASMIEVNERAEQMRDAYLAHKVLGQRSAVDALHVALATVSGCDAIVSWNFKHIVNHRLMPLYNAVNVLSGYNAIGIFTPHGVIGDDDTA